MQTAPAPRLPVPPVLPLRVWEVRFEAFCLDEHPSGPRVHGVICRDADEAVRATCAYYSVRVGSKSLRVLSVRPTYACQDAAA